MHVHADNLTIVDAANNSQLTLCKIKFVCATMSPLLMVPCLCDEQQIYSIRSRTWFLDGKTSTCKFPYH